MVLLVTLVMLVVLSTLAYRLSSRVAAQRHRDAYIVDYSKARYGCASAVKYALASLEELEPEMVGRPDMPDFSDLFALSELEYEELIAQMTAQLGYADSNQEQDETLGSLAALVAAIEANDVNDSNDAYAEDEAESIVIPGPYGPEWPFVTDPIEFEIGDATVTIEIEDENAKYPLGWALLADADIKTEAKASFETFCEWMGMSSVDIDELAEQLKEIGKIKPFKLDFKPITKTVRTPSPSRTTTTSSSSRTGTSRTRRTPLTRVTRKTITPEAQIAEQTMYFARIFHSSMLDRELLSQPSIISDSRDESALKYLGTWASTKVNINTAPRHVLEAAFVFGGDAARIAAEIIRLRREAPIEDIDELKKTLYGYTDSIRKCEKYITTTSTFFTVRVTAVSGSAKASSVIAITKKGKKVQRVAVVNI